MSAIPEIRRALKFRVKGLALWSAVIVIWWLARLPQLHPREAAAMASRFHFQRTALTPLRPALQNQRKVNPKLKGISSWISTVGAGVAL